MEWMNIYCDLKVRLYTCMLTFKCLRLRMKAKEWKHLNGVEGLLELHIWVHSYYQDWMSICIHCLYKWCKTLRCIVVKLLQEINLSFILFCISPLFILTNNYLKNANWKDCFDITLPNNLLLGQREKQIETSVHK